MRCQNCGADILEDKIYCEKCGTAIQMVPDYNPQDDIAIGKEEKEEKSDDEENKEPKKNVVWYRFRYQIVGVCLLLMGGWFFHSVYKSMQVEETVAEPEEPILLTKPTFNVAPGEYNYAPMLSISHPEKNRGLIYYTMDGTTPGEHSRVFQSPIEIQEGKTIIRAIFIRSDGTQSEEAVGTYEVTFDYPAEPEFDIPGGEYSKGLYVTITAEEDCNVYYTTNGEEPDAQSYLYRGRIYIPTGLTVLQAVAVDEDGGMSAITEAIYNVSENFTTENAPLDNVEENMVGIP